MLRFIFLVTLKYYLLMLCQSKLVDAKPILLFICKARVATIWTLILLRISIFAVLFVISFQYNFLIHPRRSKHHSQYKINSVKSSPCPPISPSSFQRSPNVNLTM